MLEIKRTGLRIKAHYDVRDDAGHKGEWTRHRFDESVAGELDGTAYEIQRPHHRQFQLTANSEVLATAEERPNGLWVLQAGDRQFEIPRRFGIKFTADLRVDGQTIGTIQCSVTGDDVSCELPAEIEPELQTFLGFLVMTMRARRTSERASVATPSPGGI